MNTFHAFSGVSQLFHDYPVTYRTEAPRNITVDFPGWKKPSNIPIK
jgi:hypothetical protein